MQEIIVVSQLEPDKFREGMARLGASVSVLTTDGPAGRSGLTATAVCSVTDSPPTLLVCVNRDSRTLAAMKDNGVVAVNVLRLCHNDLALRFSSKSSQDERFAFGQWEKMRSGAPVLADALVSFDCRVAQTSNVGSHCVLYCVVQGIQFHDEKNGLFYFDRSFCQLLQEGSSAV